MGIEVKTKHAYREAKVALSLVKGDDMRLDEIKLCQIRLKRSDWIGSNEKR